VKPERILGGAFRVRRNEYAEGRRHAETIKLRHERPNIIRTLDGVDQFQFGLQRPDALLLDSASSMKLSYRSATFPRRHHSNCAAFDQIAQLNERLLGHDDIDAVARAVRRDLHLAQPRPLAYSKKSF